MRDYLQRRSVRDSHQAFLLTEELLRENNADTTALQIVEAVHAALHLSAEQWATYMATGGILPDYWALGLRKDGT